MIRLGIIGTGGMANSHATDFAKINGVRLVACCDISAERVQAFAAKHAIPRVYTDYREMLDREKLNAVTNVTPDATHAEVALVAIERGLHVMSEKPMATSLEEARKMRDAASAAGVVSQINFSYRNASGLQKAAQAIREGKIGRVIHVEASYLQSWLVNCNWGNWQNSPGLVWRLSSKHGSAGVLGDLGCHIYDLVSFLCGDIAEIDCRLRTFDKGIPDNRLGEYVLDANDSFISTVSFANGALGTIHSSRWATGHGNSLRARVYGNEGAIEIDLDRGWDEYRICNGEKAIREFAWKTVKCRPTPNNYQRFIRAIKIGSNDASDFNNGLKNQAYLHASFVSDSLRQPVAVEGIPVPV